MDAAAGGAWPTGQLDLAALPLRPALRHSLEAAGFACTHDLQVRSRERGVLPFEAGRSISARGSPPPSFGGSSKEGAGMRRISERALPVAPAEARLELPHLHSPPFVCVYI